jgi:hypothetical protein
MTEAVTRREAAGETTIIIGIAGVFTGIMITGNEFMFHRRSSTHRFHRLLSLCRLHRRASVSFFHPSFFIAKGIDSRR